MFLKNHPDYSALPGARQNIPYAELGITGTSIVSSCCCNSNDFPSHVNHWAAAIAHHYRLI